MKRIIEANSPRGSPRDSDQYMHLEPGKISQQANQQCHFWILTSDFNTEFVSKVFSDDLWQFVQWNFGITSVICNVPQSFLNKLHTIVLSMHTYSHYLSLISMHTAVGALKICIVFIKLTTVHYYAQQIRSKRMHTHPGQILFLCMAMNQHDLSTRTMVATILVNQLEINTVIQCTCLHIDCNWKNSQLGASATQLLRSIRDMLGMKIQ